MLGWRRRRAERERGAVAVEAALVTPVILLLIFGTVEFGMYFKDSLAVSNAVRAGVRIASAEPRNAMYATDAADAVAREGSALAMANVQELWVYRAKTDGTPEGGTAAFESCSECVRFEWDAATRKFAEKPSSGWSPTTHDACMPTQSGEADKRMSVGVYLRYRHEAVTHLVFDDLSMADHAVMKFEPIPSTRGCR
jgi:hypothetical protein